MPLCRTQEWRSMRVAFFFFVVPGLAFGKVHNEHTETTRAQSSSSWRDKILFRNNYSGGNAFHAPDADTFSDAPSEGRKVEDELTDWSNDYESIQEQRDLKSSSDSKDSRDEADDYWRSKFIVPSSIIVHCVSHSH